MNGAQGRDRTTDTAIFSRMLYQLSYLGDAPRGVEAGFIRGMGGAVQHRRAAFLTRPRMPLRRLDAQDASAGTSAPRPASPPPRSATIASIF